MFKLNTSEKYGEMVLKTGIGLQKKSIIILFLGNYSTNVSFICLLDPAKLDGTFQISTKFV